MESIWAWKSTTLNMRTEPQSLTLHSSQAFQIEFQQVHLKSFKILSCFQPSLIDTQLLATRRKKQQLQPGGDGNRDPLLTCERPRPSWRFVWQIETGKNVFDKRKGKYTDLQRLFSPPIWLWQELNVAVLLVVVKSGEVWLPCVEFDRCPPSCWFTVWFTLLYKGCMQKNGHKRHYTR